MKTTHFLRQLQARPVARVSLIDQPPPGIIQTAATTHEHLTSEHLADYQSIRLETHEDEAPNIGTAVRQKESQARRYSRDKLDLSFNNSKNAYKSKRLSELVRNYFVLGLCSSDLLVQNNERIMKVSRAIFGKRVFESLMRNTFYGQFVAGENEKETAPVIRRMADFGVKTILDYGAEEDVSGEHGGLAYGKDAQDFRDRQEHRPVARTYFYRGESQCEKNLEIFFRAVEAVASTTGNTGFAAIKITALGRPHLLMRLSEIISYMQQLDGATVATPRATASETMVELLNRFHSIKQTNIKPLDEDEREMLFNLMRRMNRIATYASQVGGARCMIDAEQTYMQPAINMIALELMRQYNRKEAVIYNTYQCYLKNAYDQLRKDLASAKRDNFFFGAKLVRGAYMDQERARAAKMGYESPINETFEDTSKMYEKTLSYLMSEIQRDLKYESIATNNCPSNNTSQFNVNRRIRIMVASHNEDTIRFTIEKMKAYGIKPEYKLICFGQLYGMCDHVSFMLGQSGYSVFKYTPYGPIEEVLPYLGRRAIENHGFLAKLERERSLLVREIRDRLFSMRWFYRPVGNYKPA